MKPITHLSTEQHKQAAKLLNQAEDNLQAVCHIVSRAAYTDQTLRVMQAVRELLIDPLREAWETNCPAHELLNNLYQSVGYNTRHSKQFMQRMQGKEQRGHHTSNTSGEQS